MVGIPITDSITHNIWFVTERIDADIQLFL